MNRIGLVRSHETGGQSDMKRKRCRVNRRPIRYEMRTESCKQGLNTELKFL